MSRAEAWILGSIPIARGLICAAYGIYAFSNASGAPYFIAGTGSPFSPRSASQRCC